MSRCLWVAMVPVLVVPVGPGSARAAEQPSGTAGAVSLQLTGATLHEALHALMAPRGMRYLVLGGAQERRDIAVTASSMPEATHQVLAGYGAQGVYLGTIVIANRAAVPSFEDLWRELLDSVPEQKNPSNEELARLLLDRYAALGGDGIARPARGYLTLLPFVAPEPELLNAVRGRLVEEERSASRALPEARAYAERLEGQLALKGNRMTSPSFWLIRATPQGDQEFWAGDADLRDAHRTDPWEAHWEPHSVGELAVGRSLLLPIRVDASQVGTVASLLHLLGRSVPARFEAPPDLAAMRVAAWLPDSPVWSVLEALAIASGWRWDPETSLPDDSEVYRFRLPEGLEGRLFRGLAPECRALWRLFPGKDRPAFGIHTWRALTEAQRKLLQDGGRIPVEELGPDAQHWLRLGLVSFGVSLARGAMAKIEGAASRLATVEGFFALHASGRLRAVLRTGREGDYSVLLRSEGKEPDQHAWAGLGPDRSPFITYWHRRQGEALVGSRLGREFEARLVGESQ